jgi:hypothetical protein
MKRLVNSGPIAIDLDIGNTLQAISGILARRDSERATVWDSLAYHLEAVSFAVGDLDRMYFSILAEIQNIFAEPKPSPERIETAIAQATIYCTDGRLALRLDEWRGVIEGAAFNRALKHRKFRTLVSTLRSIDDPLKRYIQRLYHLQDLSSGSDRINRSKLTMLLNLSQLTGNGISGLSWPCLSRCLFRFEETNSVKALRT